MEWHKGLNLEPVDLEWLIVYLSTMRGKGWRGEVEGISLLSFILAGLG